MNRERTKVDDLRDALKKKGEQPLRQSAAEKPGEKKAPEENASDEGSSPGDELSRQIQAAEEEAKGHYDKLLRVMAEFENFKKRISREQEEQLKYSNEKLITELLPSLDDLDRVLDHIPPTAADEVKNIANGVELLRKSLFATLERFGLKGVGSAGEAFDPARHEAIAVVTSPSQTPGHILSVHRRGYWLGDRLLRPAMVSVAQEATSGEKE